MTPDHHPGTTRHGATRWRELPGALVLAALAAFFFAGSLDLPFGALRRLGPGYFPLMLSILLGGLSVAIVLTEARPEHDSDEVFKLRPFLAVLGAILVFAATIRTLGLVPAIFLTVAVAAAGDRSSRLFPVLALAAAVSAGIWAVFTLGLGTSVPAFAIGR